MANAAEHKKEKWSTHLYKVNVHHEHFDEAPSDEKKLSDLRKRIEPWMSAVFQSEHLSLLAGSGLTLAVAHVAGTAATNMTPIETRLETASVTVPDSVVIVEDPLIEETADPASGTSTAETSLKSLVDAAAVESAKAAGRGAPNIEDYIRVQSELLRGLIILKDPRASELKILLNQQMSEFLASILDTERGLRGAFEASIDSHPAQDMLVSFLLSFAARAASRERLNLFTTNYDRLIEYACDVAGLRPIDRFVGSLTPIFRASRLNIDLHYNPPGIRGEPRYLEGVIRLSKLHGSIDWQDSDGDIRRVGLPFGAPASHPDFPASPVDSVMIYPNPAKDVETAQYPYAELFRDFAASVCRPNSVLVTYGYGFGDDHINRVIRDMLTIPSTHLVLIAHGDKEGRVQSFYEGVGHPAQVTLLIGPHFGDLTELVERYLPKPAIDPISFRQTDLLERRGSRKSSSGTDASKDALETEDQGEGLTP